MKQRYSIILIGGSLGLFFLVAFGLFTSTVDLEYSEPVEVEPIESMELNCNPEIDKDGDNVPDNLDVKGSIDWSHCILGGSMQAPSNLSNLENVILSNTILNCVDHPICIG